MWSEGGAANQGAALMLQSRISELFGVDIHPGAVIGNGVMLDHATGIVIGSTAIVGSDVYMLHGVTLGATGKPTGGKKRHPTIGSRVILGAGCTVLGDVTVADGSTVGALGIVTKDVPEGSTVIGVNKIVSRPEPATAETPAAKQDDYTWYYDI
jgi:serine O-acetyltransferase